MAATRSRTNADFGNARRFIRKARVARTRGPDYANPVNRSSLVTKSKRQRKRGDRGRPPVYSQELVAEAKAMAMAGATDFEIMERLGISRSAFYLWQDEHPDFLEAVKAAKEPVDGRVERTLLERAMGYTYKSEKLFHNDGSVIRVPVLEHVPPDVGAMTLWLKNRQPQKWRDKQDIELSGGVDITDKTGTREMALAMLQTMREAMLGTESLPQTIEHEPAPAPARQRRRFE